MTFMKTSLPAHPRLLSARALVQFSLIAVLVGSCLNSSAREKVVFLVGEPEYGSVRTMPALAREFDERLDVETVILQSDQETRKLPDLSALADADLLVMFFRFRLATFQSAA